MWFGYKTLGSLDLSNVALCLLYFTLGNKKSLRLLFTTTYLHLNTQIIGSDCLANPNLLEIQDSSFNHSYKLWRTSKPSDYAVCSQLCRILKHLALRLDRASAGTARHSACRNCLAILRIWKGCAKVRQPPISRICIHANVVQTDQHRDSTSSDALYLWKVGECTSNIYSCSFP